MAERSHLSIGEVLSLLREEFPDVTISKIRFLESQGLVDPERTPSGYRKFYDHDVERLRWILRQQREHFLPLKVIRGRLTEQGEEGEELGEEGHVPATAEIMTPEEAMDQEVVPSGLKTRVPSLFAGASTLFGSESGIDPTGSSVTLADRASAEHPSSASGVDPDRPASRPSNAPGQKSRHSARPAKATAPDVPPGQTGQAEGTKASKAVSPAIAATPSLFAPPRVQPAPDEPKPGEAKPDEPSPEESVSATPTGKTSSAASRRGSDPVDEADSYSAEELAAAVGATPALVNELKQFGLINAHAVVAGTPYFEEGSLDIVRAAAEFARHGVEVRHLRAWRNAADREAGLFEQIVLPLLRQRNPQSRRHAAETLGELARLGGELRAALVDQAIREIR